MLLELCLFVLINQNYVISEFTSIYPDFRASQSHHNQFKRSIDQVLRQFLMRYKFPRHFRVWASIQNFSSPLKTYKVYQSCKTPTGADGHCMQARYCPLPELQQNARLLEHLCVIEQTYVARHD